jgi:C1A family cysteine protease
MSNEEFKQKYATYKHTNESIEKYLNTWQQQEGVKFLPFTDDDDDDLTKRNLAWAPIDYRDYFNAPRDQGSCGGCWAFTLTGIVEAGVSKKLGSRIPYLSPQQLLDCNTQNYGCNGGDLITGANYLLQTKIQSDSTYPYLGYSGNPCYYNAAKATTQINGYQYCSNRTANYKCQTSTIYNLLTKGPLAVVTNGGSWAFQNYSGGIFNQQCYNIDHAVILAGYGVSGTTEYWLIRNSWGSYWGESGYMRIAINTSNNYSCFIEYQAIATLV